MNPFVERLLDLVFAVRRGNHGFGHMTCGANARVVPVGNALNITKQASGTGKIDPLMALFNAVSLMALNPAERKGRRCTRRAASDSSEVRMGLFDMFRRGGAPEAQARPQESAFQAAVTGAAPGETFNGLDDPRFLEYIRRRELDGGAVRDARALRNMAVLRCVTLISEAIGLLPLNLISNDDKKQIQTDNPAHRLLKYKPNDWQTPIEFKSLMQLRALLDGQSFARVI